MDWILDIVLLILKPIFGLTKELLQELRLVKKDLNFLARQISNPGKMQQAEIEQASCNLRQRAINLTDLIETVKGFSFFSFFHILPKKENIQNASSLLIGLSNSLNSSNSGIENAKISVKIKELLLIKADFIERFSGWIVFIFVAVGCCTIVNYLSIFIKNLLGD
jgi:hypothetical protein